MWLARTDSTSVYTKQSKCTSYLPSFFYSFKTVLSQPFGLASYQFCSLVLLMLDSVYSELKMLWTNSLSTCQWNFENHHQTAHESMINITDWPILLFSTDKFRFLSVFKWINRKGSCVTYVRRIHVHWLLWNERLSQTSGIVIKLNG